MRPFTLRPCIVSALGALLLAACPTTESCPDGQLWFPEEGRCRVPDDDVPNLDGGTDVGESDAPCGGGCTSPEVCDFATNACVACIEDADCLVGDRGAACVDQVCVECDDNADCTEASASVCGADNTCGGCADDEGCMHLTATPTCDEGEMTCVQCTADDVDACASGVCLLNTSACAPMGGAGTLCGACTADTECPAGQVCAPTEFPVGSGTEVGNFCLWRVDASTGPAGDCINTPPHVREAMVTTAGGASAAVCTPAVSTCEALADFRGPVCTMRGLADPACGIEAVDDGFCPATGSAVCTVECTNFRDCPCTTGACTRQYECASNRCNSARSCDTTTGTCG